MGGRSLPWRRPRHELALLALVAVGALLPVNSANPQDESRLCLAQALVHGRLADDACFARSLDHAAYGGHLYSDKAPGLSLLELPVAQAVRLGPAPGRPAYSLRLWAVRVLTSGVAFLACAFLVGRIGEGLASGLGGAALVAFALGTLVAPLAAAGFDHVPAAALGFGAFALAWRRRYALAGLAAGAAILVEYQAALVAAVLAVYAAAHGVRPLARYAAGALPGLGLLAAYDALAFGAPWHLSYRYVANAYASDQAHGLFGIGAPHELAVYAVFAGGGGLLVASPVLVAAAAGLATLARAYALEAAVGAAVTVLFVVLNCGYFLPYGGVSPGPRFLVPALPFLALGLGPAFARHPRLTAALAAVSVAVTTVQTLTWTAARPPQQTLFGDLARIPYGLASSSLAEALPRSPLGWLGLGRPAGAVLVAAAALAALVVGLRPVRARAGPPRRRALAPVALALVLAADAFGIAGWPYAYRSTSTEGTVAAAHAAGVVPLKR